MISMYLCPYARQYVRTYVRVCVCIYIYICVCVACKRVGIDIRYFC